MKPQGDEPFGAFPLPIPIAWAWRKMAVSQSAGALGFLARKAVARSARWLRGPLDLELSDCRFRIYPKDNFQDFHLLKRGKLVGLQSIKDILELAPPRPRLVDIGANVGFWSIPAARMAGPGACILAVEPNPTAFQRLQENLRLNALSTVETVRAAVHDSDAQLVLSVPIDNLGAASLARWTADESSGFKALEVRAAPLARLLSESRLDRIDALKIDVEGHEDVALSSFFVSAPRAVWPRQIFMEIKWREFWKTDILSHLVNLGYEFRSEGKQDCHLLLKLP